MYWRSCFFSPGDARAATHVSPGQHVPLWTTSMGTLDTFPGHGCNQVSVTELVGWLPHYDVLFIWYDSGICNLSLDSFVMYQELI